MKEKKMSEPRLSGLNDEQDVGKNKILKSSNHANLDSDNMKQGWEIKKLGEVAEYFNGLTYSPKDVSDNGTIVLRSSNIQNDELDFSDIVRVNVDIKEKLFLKEGDILMCSRNGSQRLVGKTAPIMNLPEPMTFGTFMMIIRSEFSPYLLWFFKTDEFKKQISGGENTMINQVTRYMLDEIKIPLPPLPEQQRIVSILDEAFAVIERSRNAAIQNLKNTKELFESYLQGVFEKKGDGWEEQLFENCFKLKSGDNLTAKNMTEGEYPVFGGNGITGYHNEYNLSGSNVIIGRVGALCGNVRHINENIWLTDNAFKVVDFKFDFDHSFLTYLLNHKDLRSYARQAAQPVISNSSLKDVVLFFPKSKTQQQTIVRQLDALRAETQKLEAVYQKKIDDLEELKKSILQKAFSGQLSESGLAGLKDEQDLSIAKKSSKSSNQQNPDSDKYSQILKS